MIRQEGRNPKARLAIKYIFFEMLPAFILGVLIFLFILLMFQSFRLSDYILLHGADWHIVFKIVLYLSISFLPVIFPMSLLFAILLTYGRLSADSEIIAFKSLGLNLFHLTLPAILLSSLVAVLSAQTSFYLGPWGNRQMEVLIHRLGELKPGATLREGVFSEGFFDLVVYANKVDSKNGRLEKVFIYDERDEKAPMTIIAKRGQLIQDKSAPGQRAFLRLSDGSVHKSLPSNHTYTKLDFKSYDIYLFDPVSFTRKNKTPLSYTYKDLVNSFKQKDLSPKIRRSLLIEWHRRWAIAVACLLFSFLGVGLGTTTNRRSSSRSSGFVLSLAVIVGYWLLYAGMENFARSGSLPVWISIWFTNFVLAIAAIWAIRRAAA